MKDQRHAWSWELKASAQSLWPLVSDTDRFNRDCGFPPVSSVAPAQGEAPRPPGTRRLSTTKFGITAVWDERPFEWIEPHSFSIRRDYLKGPLREMVTSCTLTPSASGGTRLDYTTTIRAAGPAGSVALRLLLEAKTRPAVDRVFRSYDKAALEGQRFSRLGSKSMLATGAPARIANIRRILVDEAGQDEASVRRLCDHVVGCDDLGAVKMRAYALADEWRTGRRQTLDLFLHATRAGLLDFSWDVLCPHCRGALPGVSSLSQVSAKSHCDSCQVDFDANFDQSVELTFRPNPSIRVVQRREFCVGGPQMTPHIVAQRLLRPGESTEIPSGPDAGRYRVRSPGLANQWAYRVEQLGPASARIGLGSAAPWTEPRICPHSVLLVVNQDTTDRLAVVERIAWSDQATTALEVTSRQAFRDLFSKEILRPGENISVGSLTVVFTDLKSSTALYKSIGDAPAFGRVLDHFKILKEHIASQDGTVVKTMGDAVMAVFVEPSSAIRAILAAQAKIRSAPDETALALKCGIHCGACLAITQNERLDYFGTMVNLGARLCSHSLGNDIVISSAVREDPQVALLLADPVSGLTAESMVSTFKGFGTESFEVWRLKATA